MTHADTLINCNNVIARYPIRYRRRGYTNPVARVVRRILSKDDSDNAVSNSVNEFTALNGISFDIKQGDIIGLIGNNGAGKSTLLRHLAGIEQPDVGSIKINGRVAALLNLTTGFKSELSGIENIYLRSAILGLSRSEIDNIMDEILGFCDLGDFIYAPVRTYSSGMKARLGFAISINIKPDVLLLDEVIGVGDERFRVKAGNIFEHTDPSSALVIATHQLETISTYCTQCIWMESGAIRMTGKADCVIDSYRESCKSNP